MITQQKHRNFYIFDYFLDGEFLKWEEVEDECPACGEVCSISLDDGTEIHPKVVETEQISEDELRIFLSSNNNDTHFN